MKVYLDDNRTPSSWNENKWAEWIVVRTIENAKTLLKTGLVTVISLDYDLSHSDFRHTGLELLEWMIENDIVPDHTLIHSTHPKAEAMMDLLSKYRDSQYGD